MDVTSLVYIDAAGFHFADYPTFLAWRQDQLRTIYGQDIYLEADSQDGQITAVRALADYQLAALGAATYNQFSPASAQGAGLSRLVKINGLSRLVPSFSTAQLVIVGQANTTIVAGVAQDTLKQKWFLPASVTIPGAGTITVTGTAEFNGAVEAGIATITTIFTPTLGWQTVNNTLAATPGAPVESDGTLRLRQQVSTALPSQTVFDGTIGAVENVTGVTKVRGYENDTGSTDAKGIPAHKISVVVAGGSDLDIANAIESKKTPGTGTYGDTTVLVYDNHGMPVNIAFNRAVTATVAAIVTIAVKPTWSADYSTLIQSTVAAAINAFRIGDTVLINTLYSPAFLVGTPAFGAFTVTSITLNKNGGSFASADVSMSYNENPVCDPLTNVTVSIP